MKKAIIGILVIFAVALGLIFHGSSSFRRLANPSKNPRQEIKLVDRIEIYNTDSKYFVLVSKFTNPKTNYSLEELRPNKIAKTEDITGDFSDYIDEVITASQINSKLAENYLVLLSPSQVLPEYKTVFVEEQNIWSKNFNSANYPFKVEKQIQGIPNNSNLDNAKKQRFFFAGEIIPARAVDRLSLNVNNNYTYLFDDLREDIQGADIAVAMLENSFLGDPTPCTGCTTFVSDDRVATGLAEVGFDIISTAGNHAGDAGQKGYPNTIEKLNSSGIKTSGTGKTIAEATKPAVFDLADRKIGLIGADDIAYFYWEQDNDPDAYGTNTFSSISENGVLSIDQSKLELIKKYKDEYGTDYLVVFMSWGIEYTNKPTMHQQELGRALIDNGADLVIGSHPHWVQSIEFYQGKPIIYSLGNFIFDQTHTLQTRQSIAANFYYYDEILKSIELIPFQTCGYHQTKNDLTSKYLGGEVTLSEVKMMDETDGCIYWMPVKRNVDNSGYLDILERVFEFSIPSPS